MTEGYSDTVLAVLGGGDLGLRGAWPMMTRGAFPLFERTFFVVLDVPTADETTVNSWGLTGRMAALECWVTVPYWFLTMPVQGGQTQATWQRPWSRVSGQRAVVGFTVRQDGPHVRVDYVDDGPADSELWLADTALDAPAIEEALVFSGGVGGGVLSIEWFPRTLGLAELAAERDRLVGQWP